MGIPYFHRKPPDFTIGDNLLRFSTGPGGGRAGCGSALVIYVWEEGGAEKSHIHVACEPNQTYEILCEQLPLMRSLILEFADESNGP